MLSSLVTKSARQGLADTTAALMAAVPEGIFAVEKPRGCTSHHVVGHVRRLLLQQQSQQPELAVERGEDQQPRRMQKRRSRRRTNRPWLKVGHGGTLDPFAQGVLVLGVGRRYTRLLGQALEDDCKEYRATVQLGWETDTQDVDGKALPHADGDNARDMVPVEPDRDRIAAVMAAQFTGDIQQLPPMYSAIRVGGKRLHALAREGVDHIERAHRTATIHHIRMIAEDTTIDGAAGDGNGDGDAPGPGQFTFDVRCSKGTYVRTLGVDIARAIGQRAHLVGLVRLASGPFTLERHALRNVLSCSRATLVEHMRRSSTEWPEIQRWVARCEERRDAKHV